MILATLEGKSAIRIPNTADHAAASATPPKALKLLSDSTITKLTLDEITMARRQEGARQVTGLLPQHIRESNEYVNVLRVVQKSQGDGAEGLQVGAYIVEKFCPYFVSEAAKDGGRHKRRQIGRPEDEPVLRRGGAPQLGLPRVERRQERDDESPHRVRWKTTIP